MKTHDLVLAIYATRRGIAYALFEGPFVLVDWGLNDARRLNKNARCLKSIAKLIEMFHPDAVVVEDCDEPNSRRSNRIRRLNRGIETWTAKWDLATYRYSRGQIRQTFASRGATTKDGIAAAIAADFPELELRRPPERKPWMSEDHRMGLFDAVALALTFFRLFPKGRVVRGLRP